MRPSKILEKAMEAIEHPKHWTKGHAARTSKGEMCCTGYHDAVSFCAVGAVCRLNYLVPHRQLGIAIEYLHKDAKRYGYENAARANDDPKTTHKQVLEAFKRCIKAAKKAEVTPWER